MEEASKHIHTYDKEGNQTCCNSADADECCSVEEAYKQGDEEIIIIDHGDHQHVHKNVWSIYFPAIISAIFLVTGLVLEYIIKAPFFKSWVKVLFYTIAYLPVAWPVFKEAIHHLKKGNWFNEFFLMSIATIGAFAIGEYPEGVAVMLFYTVGELFQGAAVRKAKGNIKALIDIRPKIAHVLRNGKIITMNPKSVNVGEIIEVKNGEKIPLDATLLSEHTSLYTAAITGESMPQNLTKGELALAGTINQSDLIQLKVQKKFQDSTVARIIDLVQNATTKKSKTELLIRRIAKVYTPLVVFSAIGILLLPMVFDPNYEFSKWLYRALIFLVISCPCALLVSIPLGYFGGLGAASRNGILFKGATFLDQITKINTVLLDKTGTVTEGNFKITSIATEHLKEETFIQYAQSLESKSNHPIAKAILNHPSKSPLLNVNSLSEIPGKGIKGTIDDKEILIGNSKFLSGENIPYPPELDHSNSSIILMAINDKYVGNLEISDTLKKDAVESIAKLRAAGIQQIHMLSGDKASITNQIAQVLKLDSSKGDLLPEDKFNALEKLKQDPTLKIASVGDGINDAPMLAASDIGIAMGGLGSDVAIETADLIIQTDQPSKIATAIQIGKTTQQIIWQNIGIALFVKISVLILGAFGVASMWAAVFADVGVAFLAILNAIRLQYLKFE